MEEKKEEKKREVIDEAGRRAYVKTTGRSLCRTSGGGTLTGERSYGEVEWPADKFDTLGIFRIGALDAACRSVSIFSAWDLVTLVYVSG